MDTSNTSANSSSGNYSFLNFAFSAETIHGNMVYWKKRLKRVAVQCQHKFKQVFDQSEQVSTCLNKFQPICTISENVKKKLTSFSKKLYNLIDYG